MKSYFQIQRNPEPPLLFGILLILCWLFLQYSAQAQTPKFQGAIGSEDWTRSWSEFKPNAKGYLPANQTLRGTIDHDLTLSRKNTYLLQGVVYVAPGAVLTIEEGTVIRGDVATCGTLVISRGAKILAKGNENNPIIFTSNKSANDRKPGDWGGLVLLGNAPVNKLGGVSSVDFGFDAQYAIYGGTNVNDNSGILSFVRIEYPGNKITKDKEFNGLTLAGVGKGTIVDNIQISYSNDDSFEFYGGSVSTKNLISFKCTDDDFDYNFGYEGKLQSAIAVRHPLIVDFSGSRCIEADSYSGEKITMDPNGKKTNLQVSNVSLLVLENTGQVNQAKEAIHLGKEVMFALTNSVVSGFLNSIAMRDGLALNLALKNEIKISNCLFNNTTEYIVHEDKQAELQQYFSNAGFKNMNIHYRLENLFSNADHPTYPDFRLRFSEIAELK